VKITKTVEVEVEASVNGHRVELTEELANRIYQLSQGSTTILERTPTPEPERTYKRGNQLFEQIKVILQQSGRSLNTYEMQERLGCANSTTLRLLNLAEVKGWVSRVQRGRIYVWNLTEKGLKEENFICARRRKRVHTHHNGHPLLIARVKDVLKDGPLLTSEVQRGLGCAKSSAAHVLDQARRKGWVTSIRKGKGQDFTWSLKKEPA